MSIPTGRNIRRNEQILYRKTYIFHTNLSFLFNVHSFNKYFFQFQQPGSSKDRWKQVRRLYLLHFIIKGTVSPALSFGVLVCHHPICPPCS